MYSKHKLELNLRMRQMEKQRMEEFHQTKIRLFTNFSHELRTPLTLIISPIDELVRQAEVPSLVFPTDKIFCCLGQSSQPYQPHLHNKQLVRLAMSSA